MRALLVVLALVVGCKGGKDKGGTPAPLSNKAVALSVPKVEVAAVLGKTHERLMPFLLLVDEAGTVRVNAVATWADIDSKDLNAGAKSGPLEVFDRYMREAYAFGKQPVDAIKDMDLSDIAVDLQSLETPDLAQDDPPPPEEEDKPDDGAEESGGTGTAMALDEGKMGKKDSDRAEGQYKMQKNQEDPQLARMQAIEQARAKLMTGPPLQYASAKPPAPNEDGTPMRVAKVAGGVMEDGNLDHLRAMILAPPTLKATKLIDLVHQTQAAIAVSHAGKIRPLRINFGLRDYSGPLAHFWIEARVTAKGIVIEAVPDVPLELADMKQLGATIAKARATRGAEPEAPVDVLVDADVDAQRLVDVLVALDQAGIRSIGMGAAPNAGEIARRGKRIPTTTIGQPNAQGDLDKSEIRKVVKANKHKIEACYAKALATNSELKGTVMVQFFITPKGTVAAADAAGVDPELAKCVGGVVKAFVFPKPKGGGGVQVNYPFTMRP